MFLDDTGWDENIEEALYFKLNTGNREARTNTKQLDDKCQVGDFVWIKNKQSTKPFKDLITKKDQVIKIVDKH